MLSDIILHSPISNLLLDYHSIRFKLSCSIRFRRLSGLGLRMFVWVADDWGV